MLREDVGTGIYHRLHQLGFPFGGDVRARAAWAAENVTAQRIARLSQTEQMMAGIPVEEIARRTGIPVSRVYYHITRPPEDFGDPDDGWQFA